MGSLCCTLSRDSWSLSSEPPTVGSVHQQPPVLLSHLTSTTLVHSTAEPVRAGCWAGMLWVSTVSHLLSSKTHSRHPAALSPPVPAGHSGHAPTLARPVWVPCRAVTLSKHPFLPIPRYSRLGHSFVATTSMGACSRSSALSACIPQLFSPQTGAGKPLGSGAWLDTTGCCSFELG